VTTVRRVAARYHVVVKLAACLALFTLWVEWSFVPGWLARTYRDRFPIFRDRTWGQALGVAFELLPDRRREDDIVIVFLGDSTVGSMPQPLARHLRTAFPDRETQLIDFTFAGLYARDALPLAAKAFALRPDLVVYAMSARIVPTEPLAATRVSDLVLQWDIVSRLGVSSTMALIEPQAIGRVLVYSLWPPARLRSALARAVREGLQPRLPTGVSRATGRLLAGPPVAPPGRGAPWRREEWYLWPRWRHRLHPPTASTQALDALIALCARELRCLLYHVPLNDSAEGGFEPGVPDDFVHYVTDRAQMAGVPFEDYRDFGPTSYFAINPVLGSRDAIHPTEEGSVAFAPVLAAAVAARVRQFAP
jgi:hypothetical protein